jgi:glycosyltransferase involved in cell wall biosynthesis
MMNRRPRVVFLGIHWAPYLSGTLQAANRRGVVDLTCLFLFERNDWHPYLPSDSGAVPTTILHPRRTVDPLTHDDPTITTRLGELLPDVVFVAGYRHATMRRAIAYCLRQRTACVLIADTEGKATRSVVQRIRRSVAVPLQRCVFRAFWVPGRASRDFWSSQGVEAQRIFEGAYCLDVERIDARTREAAMSRSALRRRFGLNERDYVFLFIGRLIEKRGLEYLLPAFRAVRAGNPTVRLLVVGTGPLEAALRSPLSGATTEEGVRLLPPQAFKDLPLVYAASDAYVQPSVSEPYSLSTAQAAISGLPIVATDCVGAVYDVLVEGMSTLIVPPRRVEALTRALRWVVENQGLALEVGRASRELAMKRSLVWAADQFLDTVSYVTSARSSQGFGGSRTVARKHNALAVGDSGPIQNR